MVCPGVHREGPAQRRTCPAAGMQQVPRLHVVRHLQTSRLSPPTLRFASYDNQCSWCLLCSLDHCHTNHADSGTHGNQMTYHPLDTDQNGRSQDTSHWHGGHVVAGTGVEHSTRWLPYWQLRQLAAPQYSVHQHPWPTPHRALLSQGYNLVVGM